MPKKSAVKIFYIIGSGVLTIIVVLIFSIKGKNVSTPPVPTSLPMEAAGIREAKKMVEKYPRLLKRTEIGQQLEGDLKAFTTNSWTLEAEGQRIKITNDGTNKIHFSKFNKSFSALPKSPAASNSAVYVPLEIKQEELKVGDHIFLNLTIDWQTGKSTVDSITVMPKAFFPK